MKLAFFVSSAINLDNSSDYKFKYSNRRSAFTADERLRQTRYTIASIRLAVPDAKIFVFDVSENGKEYQEQLSRTPNVVFTPLQEIDANLAHTCRTNISKGFCEASSTQKFMEMFYDDLKQYDYTIKISGRYFFYNFDKEIFNETNKDKYLFQPIRVWDWKDWWGYPDEFKRNNKLHWAFTCTYGIGKHCLEDFYNCAPKITQYYVDNPDYANIMDFECVMYYRVLENKNILETPWRVGGWGGANGDYGEF